MAQFIVTIIFLTQIGKRSRPFQNTFITVLKMQSKRAVSMMILLWPFGSSWILPDLIFLRLANVIRLSSPDVSCGAELSGGLCRCFRPEGPRVHAQVGAGDRSRLGTQVGLQGCSCSALLSIQPFISGYSSLFQDL